MPKYFIGNILSPTDTQPEAHDPTFAFTREESKHMDLSGIPIRMEHHPDMQVGTITRSWDDKEGRKWVLGSINDDGLQARFAKYSISKGPTGTAYYTGLSLQHTHTQYASGKTEKTPVEVSLCVNPRRNDCRIAFVDSEPNQAQTEKVTYKILQQASNNNMSETQAPAPAQEAAQDAAPESAPAPAPEQPEMSPTEMMKVIIEQQKQIDAHESSKTDSQKRLEELEAKLKQQQDEEEAKEAEKARNLSKALVDQWAESLDKATMSDENKASIMKMAENYPKESMELLRIAHCASKKHQEQVKKFQEFKEMSENMALKQQFESVMSRKRPAVGTPQVQVHAASKKQRQEPASAKALSIIQKYRSNGSARDKMEALSEYQTPKRRGPNLGRSPYY